MHYSRYVKPSCTLSSSRLPWYACWYNPVFPLCLVGARRADQNKVSALQSCSPSRKIVGKAAAKHPRPALLHASARRKATGEHRSPGVALWIERVQPVLFLTPSRPIWDLEPGNSKMKQFVVELWRQKFDFGHCSPSIDGSAGAL